MLDMRTPAEIDRAMYLSKGMQYFNRRKTRAFTLNVFMGNFGEVQRACAEFDNPQTALKYFNRPLKYHQ